MVKLKATKTTIPTHSHKALPMSAKQGVRLMQALGFKVVNGLGAK